MPGSPVSSRSSRPGLAKPERRRAEAAEARTAGAKRLAIRRVARKARDETADGGARLHPCEVHAGALMDARAESEMAVGIARDVERFRVPERRRIAVGGADADRDEGARRDRHAADLRVARRQPVAQLVRALVAQHLLDGGAQQR